MSAAAPVPQPEPADDLMALADAVGVTARPGVVHPALLTDAVLDAVMSRWAQDIAASVTEDHLPLCEACGDTGRAYGMDCRRCTDYRDGDR